MKPKKKVIDTKKTFFVGILFFYVFIAFAQQSAVITAGGGFLGDKLLVYIKAQWFCYKYNLRFLYTGYSNFAQFAFHRLEKERFTKEIEASFKVKIDLKNNKNNIQTEAILYKVYLYAWDSNWDCLDKKIVQLTLKDMIYSPLVKSVYRLDTTKMYEEQYLVEEPLYFDYLYYASREEKQFLDYMRDLIKPYKKISYLSLPQDKITVAVHVREGGYFEPARDKYKNEVSLRVPQDSFYIDQIARLSQLLSGAQLYVFIFTNHSNPHVIVDKYSKVFKKNKNIIFDCRSSSSNTANLLEDIFSMSKFDCLIRPNSAFSMVAQFLGNHQIVMYPKHGIWRDRQLYIDKLGMIVLPNAITHLSSKVRS